MIRIYFNRRADYPLVWSIDQGPGTPEKNYRRVIIRGQLSTEYEPDAGDGSGDRGEDLNTPRAWLSCLGTVEEHGDSAIIWGLM